MWMQQRIETDSEAKRNTDKQQQRSDIRKHIQLYKMVFAQLL